MRTELINAIKTEIRTSYDDNSVYTLSPETINICYKKFNFNDSEIFLLKNISQKIIDIVNEKKINLDFELQKMNIDAFFIKHDLNRFLQNDKILA
jgi:hypothetical protein